EGSPARIRGRTPDRVEVDAAQRLMRLHQLVDPSPQLRIVAAGSVQEFRQICPAPRDCGQEDRSRLIDINSHGKLAEMNTSEQVQGRSRGRFGGIERTMRAYSRRPSNAQSSEARA